MVVLLAAYDERTTAGEVTDARSAASAALDRTRADQRCCTVWHVFDRRTSEFHRLALGEFDTGGMAGPSYTAATALLLANPAIGPTTV